MMRTRLSLPRLLVRQQSTTATELAHGGASYPAGHVGAGADEARLARRLRLRQDWPKLREESAGDVVAAHASLVSAGHIETNDAQAAAAAALSQLPPALAKAREARARWDAEQTRLTALAEAAAERNKADREEAATATKGGWLKSAPEAPREPAVVGPVCWLNVGRPPALQPAGCYVHGSVGSGKSTLMDLFCLFGHGEWRVRRQHGHEFALWLHESLHSLGGAGKDGKRSHVLGRVADLAAEGTDILCLDEFAVTNVADAAMFTELLRLFAERQLAVVCTTNRAPEDLYKEGLHRERYLPQLISRVRDSYIIVPIQGADYREALLEADARQSAGRQSGEEKKVEGLEAEAQVFFHGCEADAALGTALAGDAADHAADMLAFAPGSVRVSWGRSMAIPAVSNGVASFAFDDLCRVALSAEDFMYLALKFHTVFVHSIPRLSLEEHNEARRFTNLVDALYEHSVRLICHSTVPLADVLKSVEALRDASESNTGGDAERLGVFDRMYDDTPNFQLQIKELGSREKYNELKLKRHAEELQYEAQRLSRQSAPDAVEGDVGSGWSAAPASADLSAPQAGVAGVMVAAVGSLQESGFAAARALSRLKEMQTTAYLEAARQRREAMIVPA